VTQSKQSSSTYKPTLREFDSVRAQSNRRQTRKPAPRVKISQKSGKASNEATMSLDHPDPALGSTLLMEAVGTGDFDFLDGLLGELTNAAAQKGVANERELNFLLSVVKGIEPRDQVEAMLAAQMGAIHSAVMTFARRLNHVETIPQQDSAERAFNKLARTYVAQVEALKRYRSAGEQAVRVEHVTVNEGGQAIVGNVTTGGRATPEKPKATP
jgi:hypothetical protein